MKMNMHSRKMGNLGFTLMELMVVMAMSTIILTAIVGLFSGLTRSYATESARTTAQQDIRAAMDLMVMEIREAGLDPTGDAARDISENIKNGFITTSNATGPSSIEFIADLDYNGDVDDGERFKYFIDGTDLKRGVSGASAAGYEEDVLLSNIVDNTAPDPDGGAGATMPVFAYYDEDGDRTTTVDNIRVVAITLTIEEPAGRDGMITRTLTQRVRLRNSN